MNNLTAHSTDKLEILKDALASLPKETLNTVKYFQLYWSLVDGVVVPCIKVKFK